MKKLVSRLLQYFRPERMVVWSRLGRLGLERSRYIQAETGLGNFWMEATSENRSEDNTEVF